MIECGNLKMTKPGSDLDSKCVLSVGDPSSNHSIGKRKVTWELVGETEIVYKSNRPRFEHSFEIPYESGRPKLVKFDIFGSVNKAGSLAYAFDNFHVGTYVCELQDLLKADGWHSHGTLTRQGRGSTDTSYLHFEVTRQLRETTTPAKMMKVFKKVDVNKNQTLDKLEFGYAMQILAKQGRFLFHKQSEEMAWRLATSETKDVLDMAEFVGFVFGTQGRISVMIEDRNHEAFAKHADVLFLRYCQDLNKRLGREPAHAFEEGGEKLEDFDDDKYEKETILQTLNRAWSMQAGVKNSQARAFRQSILEQEVEENAVLSHLSSSKAVLVQSRPVQESMEWDKRTKARGMILSMIQDEAVATCILMNENAGPCSVRSTRALPSTGVTYFELSILRDQTVFRGSSLDGQYAVGLVTERFNTFDGSWVQPQINPACYAVVTQKAVAYEAAWSLRHKASSILVQGNDNNVAVLMEDKTRGTQVQGVERRQSMISNVRAQRNLPRGSCYFEITLKAYGKSKGESLGGNCHVGLCSEKMAGLGWSGNWTDRSDPRGGEAWTLVDNWNGQLSTTVFGFESETMSDRQKMDKMREQFNFFDKDNSGSIDWDELQLALKQMSIDCTDDEVAEMFTALGLQRDGHVHFEEFVSIIRSRAATGTLFHVENGNWCLNSFFGVGDKIGFQVDTIKGVADIFKNGKWLGHAFSDLPEVVYPFASLPRMGVSATITSERAKSINPRSDLYVNGHRKPWIEGSQFGSADRVGFLVNMDKKTCDLYKNGEYVGRAFERLPKKLYAFATLCHTGSKASMRFPPQPIPNYHDRMQNALEQDGFSCIGDIPCAGGRMDLSSVGTSCAICLHILPGGEHSRGDRRFEIRACDLESLFDCEILGGLRCARLVSPIVEVQQIAGPGIEGPLTRLTIPHCSSQVTNLKLVFMPARHRSTQHQNVWAEMDASWSSREGTCSNVADGIFCILCLDDPVDNPDLVHVEYRLFDPMWEGGEIGQACHIVSLEHKPGTREPKFSCIKLGTSLHGTITVKPISAVSASAHVGQEAVETPLPRGCYFEPLTATGSDESGRSSNTFSDTQCFATSGCILWLKSLYAYEDSSESPMNRTAKDKFKTKFKTPTATLDEVDVQWKGVPIELKFEIQSEAIDETSVASLQIVLSKRMEWSDLLEDYTWQKFRYVFNASGSLYEGPEHWHIPEKSTFNVTSLLDENFLQAGATQESQDVLKKRPIFSDIPDNFWKIGHLSELSYKVASNPESMQQYVLNITVPVIERVSDGMNDKSRNASARRDDCIVLATGRKQDRDDLVNSFQVFAATREKHRALQQILVTVTLSQGNGDLHYKERRRRTSVTFSPLTLSVAHNPIKHKKYM
jgi:hypothetical protein